MRNHEWEQRENKPQMGTSTTISTAKITLQYQKRDDRMNGSN